jgi:hypothetical protein
MAEAEVKFEREKLEGVVAVGTYLDRRGKAFSEFISTTFANPSQTSITARYRIVGYRSAFSADKG